MFYKKYSLGIVLNFFYLYMGTYALKQLYIFLTHQRQVS